MDRVWRKKPVEALWLPAQPVNRGFLIGATFKTADWFENVVRSAGRAGFTVADGIFYGSAQNPDGPAVMGSEDAVVMHALSRITGSIGDVRAVSGFLLNPESCGVSEKGGPTDVLGFIEGTVTLRFQFEV